MTKYNGEPIEIRLKNLVSIIVDDYLESIVQ